MATELVMGARQRSRALTLALAVASCAPDGGAPPVEPSAPVARGQVWWAGRDGAPPALSQTGLYADIVGKVLAPDSTGFQPRFQLWSDGAEKRRWLRLPPGTQIDNSDPDHWQLPPGAALFKEFAREGKRLETRVLARTGAGPRDYWMGAFVWNDDESDAYFMPDGVRDARGTDHDVPSQKRCGTCHDGAPGRMLGLSALQQPQLPAPLLRQPSPPSVVPGEPVTQAALGYLHANCAHCHNPRGSAFPDTDLDLRLRSGDTSAETALTQRTTLRVPLQFFRRTSTRWRVLPGAPEQSALLERMSHTDPLLRMPPLGTEQIDEAGIASVRAWIASLPR